MSRLADNALAAFAKVIVDVHNANRSGVLSQYTRHPTLRRRFSEGWMVQIGFGLHIGAARLRLHCLLTHAWFCFAHAPSRDAVVSLALVTWRDHVEPAVTHSPCPVWSTTLLMFPRRLGH